GTWIDRERRDCGKDGHVTRWLVRRLHAELGVRSLDWIRRQQATGIDRRRSPLPAWSEFMKAAVDLRPELGGKAFLQPDGITIAEVDPDTDELATGKCPMHERVALLTDQAPTAECFRHNVYF